MIRLIDLYRNPANDAAFLSHDEQVHAPLVRAIRISAT